MPSRRIAGTHLECRRGCIGLLVLTGLCVLHDGIVFRKNKNRRSTVLKKVTKGGGGGRLIRRMSACVRCHRQSVPYEEEDVHWKPTTCRKGIITRSHFLQPAKLIAVRQDTDAAGQAMVSHACGAPAAMGKNMVDPALSHQA